ncbi:hypothetical protein ACFX1X_002546 [Malus domestica]
MSSNRALEGFTRNRPLLASSEKASASCTRGASAARGAAVAGVWPPDVSEEKSVVEPGSGRDSSSQATSSSMSSGPPETLATWCLKRNSYKLNEILVFKFCIAILRL